jgi:hypothetical protein
MQEAIGFSVNVISVAKWVTNGLIAIRGLIKIIRDPTSKIRVLIGIIRMGMVRIVMAAVVDIITIVLGNKIGLARPIIRVTVRLISAYLLIANLQSVNKQNINSTSQYTKKASVEQDTVDEFPFHSFSMSHEAIPAVLHGSGDDLLRIEATALI